MESISWSQALGWRMRQQLLDPVGSESVVEVVRRLGAVQAGQERSAELSVRARRTRSRSGEVTRALAEGRLLKTFTFRGATHLHTPDQAGVHLALRAASRMWELPSWQSYYRLAPGDWPRFREVVSEALADGPLTVPELGEAVTAEARFRHLRKTFDEGAWNLLKALAWQGEVCFGPSRAGRTTFQRPMDNPRWAGIPDLEDAGRRAIETYLRAYGPAAPERLQYWLAEGLGAGRKRLQAWVKDLGDSLTEVDVEGERCYVLTEHLEELRASAASGAVRLLPGYDQWVLGPGTADSQLVPSARRALITRGANPVVVGGVVSGTWSQADGQIAVEMFDEAGEPDADALAEETARVAAILGRSEPKQGDAR